MPMDAPALTAPTTVSAPTTLSAPTTFSAPPQDTRDKILEVAEAEFARRGYEGVGMRALAGAVGMSKSALFHHFPTKLDLYEEVIDRVLGRLEAGLGSRAATSGDPIARLDAWIDSVVSTLAEDASSSRLLLRSLVEEEPIPGGFLLEPNGERAQMASERRLARIVARFRELIEEGIAAGLFRPVSIPDVIQSVIGTLVFHFASGGLGETLIGEPIFSRTAVERRRREVSDFIRRGLLA